MKVVVDGAGFSDPYAAWSLAKENHTVVLRFGKKIVTVDQSSRSVAVAADSDEEFVGDAGVTAIPFPKVKNLIKDLKLPELVRAAIDTWEMGGPATKFSAVVDPGVPPRGVQYPRETGGRIEGLEREPLG